MTLVEEFDMALTLCDKSILTPRVNDENNELCFKVVGNDIWPATSLVEDLVDFSIPDFFHFYQRFGWDGLQAFFSRLYGQKPYFIEDGNNFNEAMNFLNTRTPSGSIEYSPTSNADAIKEKELRCFFWLKAKGVIDFCFIDEDEEQTETDYSVYQNLSGKPAYILFVKEMLAQTSSRKRHQFRNLKEIYLAGGYSALVKDECAVKTYPFPNFV